MTGPAREGVVVLGAPRSGTTLLRRLLDAHPAFACPGETYLLRACARFLEGERSGVGVDVGVLAGLGHAGFDGETVVERLREFAFGFLREHATRAGKPRWAEKTAFDAFHVDAIERLCAGRVHFVCLVRHGLDVAVSLEEFAAKTRTFLLEIHDRVRDERRPLWGYARLWADVSARLAKLVEDDPEGAILVRYEDLVADPSPTLDRLFAFLGEESPPDLVETALAPATDVGLGDWKAYAKSAIDQQAVGRWRKLPSYTRSELGKIVNPLLTELGYDAVPTQEDRDAEEARRRYELGLMLRGLKPGQDEE